MDSIVYRSVLNSGGWNREVTLYTEVSSFQGARIEVFHCITTCSGLGWVHMTQCCVCILVLSNSSPS